MAPTMTHRGRSSHSDKRKDLRVPIEDVTVEIYHPDGSAQEPEICDIVNLSEGGMLFSSSRKYTNGQILRLTFIIPDTILTVRTDATVIHSFVDLSGRYVGVRFSKLDVPEQTTIRNFVQQQAN